MSDLGLGLAGPKCLLQAAILIGNKYMYSRTRLARTWVMTYFGLVHTNFLELTRIRRSNFSFPRDYILHTNRVLPYVCIHRHPCVLINSMIN